MASESLTPWTYPIWFVSNDEPRGDDTTNIFGITYESMRRCGFNARWALPQECLQIRRKKSMMFIMESFSGQVFEHLVSLNCRIVGPLCAYDCLRNAAPIPKFDHPVYSNAMKDLIISCTRIGPRERSEICRKVEFMCGTFSHDLTSNVTHLVCDEVGSKKYHVAASLEISIVDPEWVEEVWNNTQHKLRHARTLPYEYFRCPVFKGLTICVSQLSSEDRDFIKQTVEEEGGCYTADLTAEKNTHLILLEPKGEKYTYAKECFIFCVHEDWFYDSLKVGFCIDWNLYPLEESSSSSSSKSEPDTMLDCSSGMEERMTLDAPSSVTPISPVKKTMPSLEVLDSFDLSSLPECDDFLDGCKIFLSGFEDPHLKKLCKIINAGGGMRFSKYSDCISHVVCGKENSKLIDIIKESSNRPHVISFNWLIECCKEERLIDEALFSCMEKIPLSPESEQTPPRKKIKNVKCTLPNVTISENQPHLPDGMEDIIKQYSLD